MRRHYQYASPLRKFRSTGVLYCQYTESMKNCKTCNRPFEPIANQHYCQEPCRSPSFALVEPKGGSCKTCGSHIADGRLSYCSDECRPKKKPRVQKEPYSRACEGCGCLWFPSSPAVKGKLCATCQESQRETHVFTERSNWRQAVRNRASNLCEDCGATEQETGAYHHAHHIKARSEGGQNTLANGRLLCINCHDKTHGGRAVGGSLLVASPASSDDLVERIAERVVEILKRESLV
jgi:hypothetical protein